MRHQYYCVTTRAQRTFSVYIHRKVLLATELTKFCISLMRKMNCLCVQLRKREEEGQCLNNIWFDARCVGSFQEFICWGRLRPTHAAKPRYLMRYRLGVRMDVEMTSKIYEKLSYNKIFVVVGVY